MTQLQMSKSFILHDNNIKKDDKNKLPLVQKHQVLGKKFHCSPFCWFPILHTTIQL
jgi:hypothetical protein